MTNAMMNPTTTPNEPTMSSREIADVVEARHDSVKRTVNTLRVKGLIASPQVVDVQMTGGNNRIYATQEYRVGKRDSYVIVAQLSPEFTARLVDRWQELEAQQSAQPAVPNFNDPAVAARAWADAYEQQQLAQQEAQQATIERDSVIDTTTRHQQTLAEYARQFPRINSIKIKSDLKRAVAGNSCDLFAARIVRIED